MAQENGFPFPFVLFRQKIPSGLVITAFSDYSLPMDEDLNRDHGPDEWRLISPATVDDRFHGPIDEAVIRRWALVLTARSIPCRVESHGHGLHLLVPGEWLSEAVRELRLYEEENRNWPPPPPTYRSRQENTLATLSVLFLLATFHNLTRLNIPLFDFPAPDWIELGSAKVHLIHYGQWWRLITALTLHADGLHLLSNLTIGGFFVILLCRELGSGLGWSLLLTAGTIGNWVNAQVQLPTHSSVGGSTAVFGAVGILGAVNLMRHRLNPQGRWKMVGAAALALLTLLGTEGKNTDLGAHLFGFLAGGGLGAMAEMLLVRYGRPGRLLNGLLAFFSGLLVILAWAAAIANGSG